MSQASACLQLDVGNSSAKWRLVADGQVVARGRYLPGDGGSRDELLRIDPTPDRIWVSSVAAPEAEGELAELLRARWDIAPWFARTRARSGDLRNSYREPSRMGVDRWLAMLGARQRSRDRLCVVDAGSALTIDLVDADGTHLGGYILPGAALMERALLLDTERVRFDDEEGYQLSPGASTAQAVRHGVALAQAGAVKLALDRQAPRGDLGLFFCGGGAPELMRLLNAGGEHVPDLVFEGLEVMAADVSVGQGARD